MEGMLYVSSGMLRISIWFDLELQHKPVMKLHLLVTAIFVRKC